MTIYLRNKKNETLLDIECYVAKEDGKKFVELHSVVPIKAYSEFLVENIDDKERIISMFDDFNELRGWLWEVYFMGEQNDPERYDDVIKQLKDILKQACDLWGLSLVTD